MDFISGNSAVNRGTSDNYKSVQNGFRMNYPDSYRSQIELTKFERDTDKDNIKMYHYTMVDAFPLSMDPIEISYGQSDLLRLNVNFSIVRYVVHPISETSKTAIERTYTEGTTINIDSGKINVKRNSEEKRIKAFHGLTRSLVNNMVIGVKEGFEKSLDIMGTGYKCDIKSKNELVLSLGYSNPINFSLPDSINAEVENKGTVLKISGVDKELVGEITARIRKLRKPERYKGKGVRYSGEVVKLKAGKAAGGKGAK